MTLKEKALDFLIQCSTGNSKQAFAEYVGENMQHHNIYFSNDPQVLMQAMEDSARENPEGNFEILRALEDENMVAVHSRYRRNSKDLGYAIMHIMRFDAGKIVEFWDFGQEVPETMMNTNGMF